jgi:hypothetical protein
MLFEGGGCSCCLLSPKGTLICGWPCELRLSEMIWVALAAMLSMRKELLMLSVSAKTWKGTICTTSDAGHRHNRCVLVGGTDLGPGQLCIFLPWVCLPWVMSVYIESVTNRHLRHRIL